MAKQRDEGKPVPAATAVPAHGERVVEFVGATLIDGSGGKPVADARIRVQGGRVVSVAAGSNSPRKGDPAADETVDLKGKWVVPGLIDAHCHISYGEGRSAEEVDVYGGAEWSAVRAVWNAGKVLRSGVTSTSSALRPSP